MARAWNVILAISASLVTCVQLAGSSQVEHPDGLRVSNRLRDYDATSMRDDSLRKWQLDPNAAPFYPSQDMPSHDMQPAWFRPLCQLFPAIDLDSCYENLGVLGVGGVGIVYKAKDRGTGMVLAAKLIPKVHMAYYGNGAALPQEVKLMQRAAQHPSFVGLHGVTHTRDHIVILMDLVPGCCLLEYYQLNWWEGRLRVFAAQCLSALAFLDQQGIVHRDIKFENILFDQDGRAKICDLGSATDAPNHVSMSGTVVNWPPEMLAPQHYQTMRGGRRMAVGWTHKADIWLLAKVLYALQCKQPPFPRDEALYSSIQEHGARVQFLHDTIAEGTLAFDETVSEDYQSFMSWALAKDPNERPSAEQLLEHPWLRGVDAEQPVVAPLETMPPYVLDQTVQQERAFFDLVKQMESRVDPCALDLATSEFIYHLLN